MTLSQLYFWASRRRDGSITPPRRRSTYNNKIKGFRSVFIWYGSRYGSGSSILGWIPIRMAFIKDVQATEVAFKLSKENIQPVLQIRIRDPVPFWPLNPGSGIGFFQIPDLGSQTHMFESLVTIIWVKSYIILWKLTQIFFFSISTLK